MVLARLNPRLATLIRAAALVLISWSVLRSRHHRAVPGAGWWLLICFVACVVAWIVWTIWPNRDRVTADVYVLAVAGGVLAGAAPSVPPVASCSWRCVRRGSRAAGAGVPRRRPGRTGARRRPVLAYDGKGLGAARLFARVRGHDSRRVRQPPGARPRGPGRADCSPRRSASHEEQVARRGCRSRRGSPVRSMTCSRTRSRV